MTEEISSVSVTWKTLIGGGLALGFLLMLVSCAYGLWRWNKSIKQKTSAVRWIKTPKREMPAYGVADFFGGSAVPEDPPMTIPPDSSTPWTFQNIVGGAVAGLGVVGLAIGLVLYAICSFVPTMPKDDMIGSIVILWAWAATLIVGSVAVRKLG